MTKGQKAGNDPITIKVEKGKITFGVLVVKVKDNLFVTVHTKDQILHHLSTQQKKVRKYFFVTVNKLKMLHFAMDHI